MSERNYWQRMRRRQMSRRALLGASARAGVGAAGLALVGCGDDDDDGQAAAQVQQQQQAMQQQAQQQAMQQQQTQQQAMQQAEQAQQQEQSREDAMEQQQEQQAAQQQAAVARAYPDGGMGGNSIAPYVGLSSGDPPTLDPYENLTYRAQHAAGYHYSKLIREIEGAPGISAIATAEISPDAATGMPEIVDELTYIFDIREDIHWHDVEPTNGRQMSIDDILLTHDRFREVSANAAGWDAVVDQFNGGEDRTIEFKLHQPHAPFLTLASSSQHLFLIPQEIVDAGTVAEHPVGSGPWIFEEFEPNVALRWRRNPNWHIQSPNGTALPLVENLTASMNNNPDIIIANMAAGQLDYTSLSGSTFLQMRDAIPADYDQDRYFTYTENVVPGGFYFNFSIAPWNDQRMRLALSMSLDRGAVQDATDDTGQGGWLTAISQLPPFWLDPKDLDSFGETFEGADSGLAFHVDLQKAHELMDAAGYGDGIQARAHNTADYGASANNFFEACVASVSDGGFQFEIASKEYAAYIASTFRGNFPDNWDGVQPDIAIGPLYGGATDPQDILAACYHRSSGRHNWGSAGRSPDNINTVLGLDTGGNAETWQHPNAALGGGPEEDERLHDMFAKQREILDFEERVEYIHDIQRYMATKMYLVPYPANAGVWAINPFVKHLDYEDVHIKATYGRGNAFIPHIWIDQAMKDELT